MSDNTPKMTASSDVREVSCPACTAPMRFDPGTGKMLCDFCGTALEIEKRKKGKKKKEKPEEEKSEENLSGFDFASLGDQAGITDGENLPIYSCTSCGAELIAPAEQISMLCPYCGSSIILTDKISGNLRPDGIIPFKVSPSALPDTIKRFYKGKALLSDRFLKEHIEGKVTGVYVPFWLFSGTVSGDLSFIGEKSSSYRKGDYIYTDTEHYSIKRAVSLDFEDIPVDASGKIDDKLMDSLEPFDLNEAVPFDMRYLSGFTADRFDVSKDEIAERAKNRMFRTAEANILPRVSVGYSAIHRSGGKLNAALTARYLLFPVYLMNIFFNGHKYELAVNGQTGETVGELPIDKGVSIRYFLIRMLPVTAAILLIFILKYLTGN